MTAYVHKVAMTPSHTGTPTLSTGTVALNSRMPMNKQIQTP
jgi:hypothetical protein